MTATPPLAGDRRAAGTGRSMAPILVDHTHLGRHVTGLERITLELFSPEALAPLPVEPVTASGLGRMVLRQTLGLPASAALRGALVLCPGFPPSPLLTLLGGRVIPYVHDTFLITRRQDLNRRALLYMAAPFRLAVGRLPRFLVNSETTARELARFCRSDAEITLYRPRVRNVFGLDPGGRAARDEGSGPRLIALGTVEPRKNLSAAAALVGALRAAGRPGACLDVVGREGWGPDAALLRAQPGVTLHGYQPPARVRALIEAADALVTTSFDEGLGLPLLEAQYAGLPVIAPDKPVFREVLGAGFVPIDPLRPAEAAARVAGALGEPGWRGRHAAAAGSNLDRWNAAAAGDRGRVVELLSKLARLAPA